MAKIVKITKNTPIVLTKHIFFGRPKSREKKEFCDTVEKGLGPRTLAHRAHGARPWGP